VYLAEDLSGLLEPHPEVAEQDGAFSCGAWTAQLDGDRLELSGDGRRIDGLRALCAAAWAAADERDGHVSAEAARPGVEILERRRRDG
jgi:hypothetical protein